MVQCSSFVSKRASGKGAQLFFFLFQRRDQMGKGWHIFAGRFRVFRDAHYKIYFTTLILLTIYVQTENCGITCSFSLMFLYDDVLLKVFLIVFYCLCDQKQKRNQNTALEKFNTVSNDMNARKSAIFAFQFVKPILQTITQLIQYTVLTQS